MATDKTPNGQTWRIKKHRIVPDCDRVGFEPEPDWIPKVPLGSFVWPNGKREWMHLFPHELREHTLLLGATGSGKTTTLMKIAQGAAWAGISIIAIDLKGSPTFADQIYGIARQIGGPYYEFSLDSDELWNPLAQGDATELKDKLIGMEQWSEPHYKRAAERYLQTVFNVMLALDLPRTLQTVVELMSPAGLNAVLRDLPQHDADRIALYLDEVKNSRDQRSAVQGLATRLALLTESAYGPQLKSPPADDKWALPIKLDDAINYRLTTLFSLDSLRHPELAPQIAGLVIQDLKTVASTLIHHPAPQPALILIDEFSALDGDQLLGLLARAREANIGVVLSTQDLADLTRVDPTFTDQVLANTNVKLVHRQEVPESAERLAGTIGTYQDWDYTYAERSFLAEILAGQASPVIGSKRLVEKYHVHPNTFKNLRRGQTVLSIKNPGIRTGTIDVDPPVWNVGL